MKHSDPAEISAAALSLLDAPALGGEAAGASIGSRMTRSRDPGCGRLKLRRVGGKTTVVSARADSPLKLLAPRSGSDAAWIFTSTYGGGLVAGDDIRLTADLGAGTACLLGTQASTKVFRSTDGRACRQGLNVTVGENALCVSAPHPVTCFADARFVQRQRFAMAPGASLVLVDWLTSGRLARGERWAFTAYDSRTDIFSGGRHVFRDALRLDAADGPIAALHRTGGLDCFAYAVVLGDPLAEQSQAILRRIEQTPASAHPNGALLVSASPLPAGVVIRATGAHTQAVGRWLRQQLDFVPSLLGDDPWARLW